MNKAAIILMAVGVLSVMAGCKEDKTDTADNTTKGAAPEAVQTVEWYKAHNTERNTVLTKCRNNPGSIGATPNCINASRADSSNIWAARGGAIKLAPLTAADLKNK
jgi:predicted Fe-S protein YdhL (DUF1289 family)